MRYEFFISLRYLQAKRKQAFISLISIISIGGVAVGVWALIVVLAVMSGFKEKVQEKILGMQPHVLIHTSGAGITPQEFQSIHDALRPLPEFVDATPYVSGQVMISAGRNPSGARLYGIDVVRANVARTKLNTNMREGSAELLNEKYMNTETPDGPKRDGIILGWELARLLGVLTGDEVTVLTPSGYLLPTGLIPKQKKFRVVGVFYSGFIDDMSRAYISLTAAQKFFSIGTTVSGMEVWLRAADQSKSVVTTLQKQYASVFQIQDWTDVNKSLFSAMKLEKLAMFLITGLIGLVAAFNIISTLVMMVMEKHADIATLKSMGATSTSIMKIFMLEGSIIGVLGTALGTILGVAACWAADTFKWIPLQGGAYFFDHLPFAVNLLDVLLVVGGALAICFLSTLYPARHASQLDPVAVFRYE